MRVILVEFAWQTKEIINNKSFYKDDLIVSLDSESSYILKSKQIKHHETYEFCNHFELWSQYKDITNRSINITKILDEALWKTDDRFKNLKWEFFNDYHYPLKISFDQLFYYSELISKIIEKFKPSEIIVADTKKILIDNNFLIDSKISVIKYLLKTLEDPFNKIKISHVSSGQSEKKQFIDVSNFIKRIIKNSYYKIGFLVNYYTTRPKYISVDCNEILNYKKLYPKESKLFLNYNQKNSNNKKFVNNSFFFNKFMMYLKNETNFYELIKNRNISFKLIFDEILFKLTVQLDSLIYEYNKTKKILHRIKPRCLIFNSMTPFNSATVAFKKGCIDLKIPFVTWVHGGFGLTYSLASYDVTDFRLCKNHISYGTYLKDLVENDSCILKQLGFQKNQKIFSVGSPKFDYENRNQNLSKKLKKNDKPTVLYLLGLLVGRNHFYFGRNREKYETSAWEFHHDVLCLLEKYQNKYNIIFKDYPNGLGKSSLWKKILKDINADKIQYISNEHKVNDLLRISDLNIIPWTSTTFFEALYFDADIFLYEEDIFEKPFEKDTKGEIYYFKNEKKFLSELEKYLETGNFYTRKKENSKNYFIKFDNFNKRDQLLNDILAKIH